MVGAVLLAATLLAATLLAAGLPDELPQPATTRARTPAASHHRARERRFMTLILLLPGHMPVAPRPSEPSCHKDCYKMGGHGVAVKNGVHPKKVGCSIWSRKRSRELPSRRIGSPRVSQYRGGGEPQRATGTCLRAPYLVDHQLTAHDHLIDPGRRRLRGLECGSNCDTAFCCGSSLRSAQGSRRAPSPLVSC